jgi:hypothetical protein
MRGGVQQQPWLARRDDEPAVRPLDREELRAEMETDQALEAVHQDVLSNFQI